MDKNNIYKRHVMALKHIKLLKEPTVKILNNVLSLKARINKKHFIFPPGIQY